MSTMAAAASSKSSINSSCMSGSTTIGKPGSMVWSSCWVQTFPANRATTALRWMPWRAISQARAEMSCRWLMSKGPQALTTAIAAFAASWRFSNCTVRAGNHRNKEIVKTKVGKIRTQVFLESILSQNHPIYKSTSTKTIIGTIKFSHLSPYKPGSQLKPRRISNQLAYNQDRSNST